MSFYEQKGTDPSHFEEDNNDMEIESLAPKPKKKVNFIERPANKMKVVDDFLEAANEQLDEMELEQFGRKKGGAQKRTSMATKRISTNPVESYFDMLSEWNRIIPTGERRSLHTVDAYYPDLVYCAHHQTWNEAKFNIVSKGEVELSIGNNKPKWRDPDCGKCFKGQSTAFMKKIMEYLSGMHESDIDNCKAEFMKCDALLPRATNDEALRKLRVGRSVWWYRYEILIFDRAERYREEMKHDIYQRAQESTTTAIKPTTTDPSEHPHAYLLGDDNWKNEPQLSPPEIARNQFRDYITTVAIFRPDVTHSKGLNSDVFALYCSKHDRLGDSVPFRDPKQYQSSCFICVKESLFNPNE